MPPPGSPITAIWRTVQQIVDYLPSLRVVADNKTTAVSRTPGGQVIHSFGKGLGAAPQAGVPIVTSSSSYEGPWKLSYDQATNRAVVTDGYFIAGNSRFGATGTTSVSLGSLATGKVYVFLHCYVTSEGLAGTWHWELLAWNNQDYLIQQTGWTRGLDYRHFCVTVGVMDYDAENLVATGIQQWHTGNVYISGRMV